MSLSFSASDCERLPVFPVTRHGRWLGNALRRLCRTEPLPRRPLVVVAAAVAAGCAIAVRDGWLSSVAPAWVLVPRGVWVLAVGCLIVWAGLHAAGRPRPAALVLAVAVCLAAASWAAARFDLFAAADLAWQLDTTPRPVAVEGRLVSEPRSVSVPAADRFTAPPSPVSECVLEVLRVRHGTRWHPAAGRAAVLITDKPPDIAVGARVRVLGRALRPLPALNPLDTDPLGRARAARCLSVIRVRAAADLRVLPATRKPAVRSGGGSPAAVLACGGSPAAVLACGGSPAAAVLPQIRKVALAAIDTHVPEGQRGLAAALLLGSRECLARNELDGFLVTGTVHLLAISGLHVGLIAYGLHRLLRLLLLPRRRAAVVVAVFVGFYMVLVRSETPVVRATLVVWLATLAVVIDRRSSAINALAVAAIVLLAWRPADVMSAGAQLSFLSTAVLVGVAGLVPPPRSRTDPIERLIERSRPWAVRWLCNAGRQTLILLVAGVAVWAATAPLVAARFQMVSPLGIVLNVVLSPLVAAAMACGFVCLLVAPWAPPLAAASGLACGGTLGVIQQLVALAAAVPGGHLFVPPPPGWWVAGWYAGLVVACCRLSPPRLRRATTWLALAGGWCVVGILGHHAAWLMAGPPPGLRIVAAAVGHGCGIVVRTPEGRTLVYDAGRLGAPAAARRAVAGVLWNHGIRRIDTLVVSHADADHFNAVPGLLERFTVGEIVVSPAFGRQGGPPSKERACGGSPTAAELACGGSPTAAELACGGSPTAAGYLLELARRRGVPVRVVQAGDRFALDRSCLVRVLHPAGDDNAPGGSPGAAPDAGRRTTDNETSLVLAIDAAGRRLLLTGDLEGPALAAFAAGGPGVCDVLMAPHHGSRTSLPPDIAVATRPEWVLVSGRDGPHWPGVREAYRIATGHPHAVVAQTGAAGAIAIDLAATGLTASRFTGGRWRPVPDRPWAASEPAPRR